MIIECPGCGRSFSVDLSPAGPEGVRVQCEDCKRRFVIRPHGASTPAPKVTHQPLSPVALGPSEPDRDAPAAGDGRDNGDPPQSIFLERDEIPWWMVHAYEEMDREVEPETREGMEPPAYPPDVRREPAESTGQDFFVEPPDAVQEMDVLAGFGGAESPARKPYPFGQDILIGRRRPRRRLRLWAGMGGLAAAIILAALLSRRCSGQEVWHRVKSFKVALSSLASFGRLGSGNVQIVEQAHRFVKRNVGGTVVFVIQGTVTNRSKEPCRSIQVKGTLFDERGNQAAEQVVFCGNTLTTEQIQSYPKKKILEILENPYGETLSNFHVDPGKSIPFMLIFFEPPEEISEFSVEVHDYSLERQGPG